MQYYSVLYRRFSIEIELFLTSYKIELHLSDCQKRKEKKPRQKRLALSLFLRHRTRSLTYHALSLFPPHRTRCLTHRALSRSVLHRLPTVLTLARKDVANSNMKGLVFFPGKAVQRFSGSAVRRIGGHKTKRRNCFSLFMPELYTSRRRRRRRRWNCYGAVAPLSNLASSPFCQNGPIDPFYQCDLDF